MNLAIDIGNTMAKMAVIEAGQVVDTFKFEDLSLADVKGVFNAYPGIEAAVMISARDAGEVKQWIKAHVKRFVDFTSAIPVPIKNGYRTPHTLGPDRLAAAVGAATLYPGANVLVADFGSAITIDMVSAGGEYLGGNISPGAAMRFRALNTFTRALPLCQLCEQTELVSRESVRAIESGVVNGIVYEIEGYIARLEGKYGPLKIIFTGGDGNFFAKRFKNPIFATYDLVAYGLNRILEYNAD
ncbi:MAG: type III pantothenate kinase [Rikenellaceae bacterium]|jgi:type III pantothenate kinase|nr:type III pantothenate kinase [Rikenellaceae bacterium]